MGLKAWIAELRNILIVVLTPLVFLPFLLSERLESKCAFVVLLMAVYWITEAMPLPATSFLPIFLFPLLGIISVDQTCQQYLKSANFLFVGGLIVAIATEEANLHKRIALRALLMMGPQPRWLMLGFMIPSAFLSMWMSNVATVAMMAPIATCVLSELIAHARLTSGCVKNGKNGHAYDQIEDVPTCKIELIDRSGSRASVENGCSEVEPDADSAKLPTTKVRAQVETKKVEKTDGLPSLEGLDPKMQGLCKAVMLSICFSASLGGTGTLTGTGPNIVFVGQLKDLYPSQDKINFLSWMAFAVPPMILCLIICWVVLLCVFVGWRSIFKSEKTGKTDNSGNEITAILKSRYEELGDISFAEWSIIFWFCTLVFIWIFRNPLFVAGWPVWLNLKASMIQDSVGAMLVSTILFVWPKYRPFSKSSPKKPVALLTWDAMKRKFPWGVVILLGGGYALAKGVEESKLATWIGCAMVSATSGMSKFFIAFAMTCLITLITQIASNSAVATVFIPVLAKMADLSNTNPLFFLLPCVVSVSYAFVLPVGTPPNAVIFEYKMMKLKDMVLAGTILCVLCVAVIMLTLYTLTNALFDLDHVPDWARLSKNITCSY